MYSYTYELPDHRLHQSTNNCRRLEGICNTVFVGWGIIYACADSVSAYLSSNLSSFWPQGKLTPYFRCPFDKQDQAVLFSSIFIFVLGSTLCGFATVSKVVSSVSYFCLFDIDRNLVDRCSLRTGYGSWRDCQFSVCRPSFITTLY